MWFLYLDESGDLGFDFVNKKPSKFFTVTILAVSEASRNRAIINGVKKTLKRKLKKKTVEIKGSKTSLELKRYFYKQLKDVKFGLYSLTLNKRRVFEELTKQKARVYNYISRLVLDQIPFEEAISRVYLFIDKSKSKPEIEEFNSYIIRQLQGRLDPKVPLEISHPSSNENKALQAVDMFCWGIFRKYERQDTSWFDTFKSKVLFDQIYL